MEFEGKKVKIEEAIDIIEDVVDSLENGEDDLESNIKKYKKAMQLCLKCEESLKKSKMEIEYFDAEHVEESL